VTAKIHNEKTNELDVVALGIALTTMQKCRHHCEVYIQICHPLVETAGSSDGVWPYLILAHILNTHPSNRLLTYPVSSLILTGAVKLTVC